MAVNRAVFKRRARRFVSSFLPLVLAVSSLSAISVITAPSAKALSNADCTPTVSGLTASAVASGNDCIITFTSGSGSWTVPSGVTSIAIVVVGGGGGGGGDGGSGGGGGELRFNATQSVTPGATATIAIGAGGAPGSWSPAAGSQSGSDTTISGAFTYTAKGGTGGLGWTSTTGGAGGTGGTGGTGSNGATGGGGPGNCAPPAPAATVVGSLYFGAVGPNGPSTTVISSPATNYGGGGGGGLGADTNNGGVAGRGSAGGLGGGGRGANYKFAVGDSLTSIDGASAGQPGTANTGGGGGGGSACNARGPMQLGYDGVSQRTAGGAGGSGVVVIRFTVPTLTTPSTPDLDAASDTGQSSTDNTTNDSTPTFSGTAAAGSTIQLYADGVLTGSTCLTNSGGAWTCTTGTLSHKSASYAITATSTFGFGTTTTSAALSTSVWTLATSGPSMSWTNGSGTLLAGQTANINFATGRGVYNFVVGDVTVTGGSLSSFTEVNNRQFTAVFTPTANSSGTATFNIAANALQDIAGNNTTASTAFSITYNTLGACSPTTTSSGGYTYVAFKNLGSCNWTPAAGVTAIDLLVVAGGGGGASRHSGGGGAGGLINATSVAVNGSALTIAVGAGGAGGAAQSTGGTNASNGESSVVLGGGISTRTANGGGGGSYGNSAGSSGGSGGGGGSSGAGGSGNQGNSGSAGLTDSGSYWVGGGGGGAGGAATTSSSTKAGSGGAGLEITWIPTAVGATLGVGTTGTTGRAFAGGGGGGTDRSASAGGDGGTGGGGAGATWTATPSAGTANTGGGGGGSGISGVASGSLKGGDGGSGVVIVRYANSLTITYDTQGGSAITSGTTTTGGSIATSPGTPTRTGFTFNGWFTASTGGSSITFPYTHNQTANFSLFAQWSQIVNGSMLFGANVNSFLTVPNSAGLKFGTGAFTIEWWQYQTDSQNWPRIFESLAANSNREIGVSIESNTFYWWSGGSALCAQDLGTGNKNAWLHFAVSRSGSTTRVFKNGTQICSFTDSKDYQPAGVLKIGAEVGSGANTYFGGNITNFHWVKGSALYTTNFTRSTTPTATNANSILLLNAQNQNTFISDLTGLNTVTNNGNNVSWSTMSPFTSTSSVATLSALSLSTGTLSPTFASGTTSYTASVSNATSSITVTPTVTQANATIQVKVGAGSYASVTSGSASGSLTLATGSNTITVLVTAQDGTTTATYAVTVTRGTASQTITFGSLSNKTLGSGTYSVSATSSSSLAVALTSATPAVCTISSGTITLVAAGTCTINANQAGDSSFSAATQVQQSFTVATALTITTPSGSGLQGNYNTAFTNLTISSSGGAGSNSFSATGSLPAGVALSTAGVISGTPSTAGNFALTVTVTDANGATATTSSFTISIAKGVSTISISVPNYTFTNSPQGPDSVTKSGSSGTVTYVYAGRGSTTYASSSTKPTAAGTYTVTATLAADSNFASVSASADFEIANAAPTSPTITSIVASNKQLDVIFTAASGSAITKYQYSTDGGTTWRDRASGTTASPLVITTASSDNSTLVNSTSYNVMIRAFNGTNGTASTTTSATPIPLYFDNTAVSCNMWGPGTEAYAYKMYTPSNTTITSMKMPFRGLTNVSSISLTLMTHTASGPGTVLGTFTYSSTSSSIVTFTGTAKVPAGNFYWVYRATSSSTDPCSGESNPNKISNSWTMTKDRFIAPTVTGTYTSAGNTASLLPVQLFGVDGITYSSDSTLSALAISSGTLSPTFASATTAYTATVTNATSSITVTPTRNNAFATITVNGTAVTSGTASAAINLSFGDNQITVVGTSEDGTTTSTYTITVTRPISTDANLSALAISSGTLSPTFAGATTSYTASVTNATTSITVTPTRNNANATITVNGTAVTSGSASGSISLNVGANTITVVVTAQDGTTTKTYTVTVTRAGSNDASLSALTISSGTLSPTFAAATTSYTATVSNATTSITVTPTRNQANATITVNGNAVTSGSASGSLSLAIGNNTITVIGTAQDGTTTRSYTLTVKRLGPDTVGSATFTGTQVAWTSNTYFDSFSSQSGVTTTDAVATNGMVWQMFYAHKAITIPADGIMRLGINTYQNGNNSLVWWFSKSSTTNTVGSFSSPAQISAQTSYSYSAGGFNQAAANSAASIPANTYFLVGVTSGPYYRSLKASGNRTATISGENVVTSINTVFLAPHGGGATNGIPTALGGTLAAYTPTFSSEYTQYDGFQSVISIKFKDVSSISTDATLSALTTSTGTLSPTFASETTSYTATVSNATTSITVTPTRNNSNTTITVNGIAVTSGSASSAISLTVGSNTITVVGTAEDGTTRATYTLTITRQAPTYTVTYNGNSNTGGSVPTDSSSPYLNAATVTVLGNTGTLVRTNYTFNGWNTAAGGTGTSYAATGLVTFTMGSANVILYAQWIGESQTITYAAGTGGSGSGPTSPTSVAYASTFTTPANTFTRAGYSFAGWSDGISIYAASARYPATGTVAGNVILTATWTANSLSITYDSQGGTVVSSGTVSTGASISTAPTAPTRAGYTFSGWSATSAGSVVTFPYAHGQTTNFTLYAIWAEIGASVYFHADDYTDASTSWTERIANAAGTTATGGMTKGTSPTSVVFAGKESSNSDRVIGSIGSTSGLSAVTVEMWIRLDDNGSTQNPFGSMLFSWSANAGIANYNIFHQGGKLGFNTFSSELYGINSSTHEQKWRHLVFVMSTGPVTNQKIYVNGVLQTLSYQLGSTMGARAFDSSGNFVVMDNPYAANTWNAKGNLGILRVYKGELIASQAASLYNATKSNYEYLNVTYNSQGGSAVATGSTALGGSIATAPTPPVRTGYTFAGWSTTSSGSVISFTNGYTHGQSADFTLYAQWTANSLTVTYNSQGGSVVTAGSVNTAASISAAPTAPTRAGYTFAGWSATDGGTAITFPYAHGQTTDFTLYAKWTANTNNAITYNNQSATTAQSGGSTTYTTAAAIATIPTTAPLKTGYTFTGWFTAATDGTQVTNGTYIPASPFGAITLYAQWSANALTITYDSKGGTAVTSGLVNTGASISTAPTAPTRAGYTFSAWSATDGGTAITFPYVHGKTANFTLYALWTAGTLVVTYNAKGGTSVSSGSTSSGASISAAPTAPTRTGYTLAGWSASDTGTVVTFPFAHGQTANFTLYAQWTGTTNAITYDSKGGSSIANGSFVTGGSIAAAPTAPIRAGYTLTGWSLTEGGSAITYPYSPSATSGITLHAIWAAISCSPTSVTTGGYTIYTFTTAGTCFWTVPSGVTNVEVLAVAGGGGGGYSWDNTGAGGGAGGQVKTGTATLGTTIEITVGAGGSAGIVSATRGGSGGNSVVSSITALGGTGGCAARATTCSNSAQATSLAAANGGVGGTGGASGRGGGGSNTTASATSTTAGGNGTSNSYSGSAVTYGAGGTGGTARGAGTNIAGTAGSANTGNGGGGASAKSSSGEVNGGAGGSGLVVVRIASALTVAFDSQGGSAVSDTSTVTAGILSEPTAPTRSTYTFLGWFTATTGGSAITFPYTHGQTANFTLYARWTLNAYAIVFNANNGSGTMANQSIVHGVAVNLSANLFTRANYVFHRWAVNADGSGTTYNNLAQVTLTAGTTLFAQWTANTYVVTYSYNNATGGNTTTTSSFTTGGSGIVLPTPTRTGYTFGGWYLDSGLSNQIGLAGASYSPTGTTLSLNAYAKWTAIDYTFTYDGNNSDGGTVPTETSKQITQTATVKANTGSLIRAGYTFAGWNTQSNGTGDNYLSGSLFTVQSSNVTLYAKWSANSYTITYNSNGGTGSAQRSSSNVSTDTYTTGGSSVALPGVGTLTRSGYTFGGWNTSAAGTGTNRLEADTFTTVSDVIFYAKWNPVTYSITYDANTGTGTAPTTGGYTTGQASPYSVVANTFTKTLHVFGGWNTADNGTGTNYSPGSTITTLSNITLYAIWIPQFTLHYAINGGTVTSGSLPADQLYNANTLVTSIFSSVARTGYTFGGWRNGSSTIAGGGSFTIVQDSVLTAIWTPIDYTISYDSDGGTTPPNSFTKQIGQSFEVGSAVVKPGYNFTGWKAGSTTVGAGATVVTGSSNISYTAQWAAKVYRISYDWNGGRGTAVSDVDYTFGTTAITLPLVGDRVRDGYTFAGWSETLNGSALNATYIPSQTRTLFARWNIGNFTVTYDAGRGTVANSTVAVQNGSATVLPLPTRANFVFNGWHTAVTGGSSVGSHGASFTPTSSQTVYARWIQSSLFGITDSLTRIGSVITADNVSNTFSGANSNSSVAVSVPANALPAGTTINFDLVGNSSRAVGLLPGVTYVVSMAISWLTGDETVPDTASGKPISVTITNSSIKAGAVAYAIVNNVSTLLGTATQDGSITVELRSDPEVVVAATKPGAPTNVSASSNGAQQSVVSWTAPSSNGGAAISGYTVTASPGAGTCTTTSTSCTISSLTNGTAYTFTVIATNSVGNSPASSAANATTAALHTVTFDAKGGSTVTAGSFLTTSTVSEPTAPTRAGYSFAGWSATDGGTAITFPYAPGVATNITMYARWDALDNAVTFDSKGGSSVAASVFSSGGNVTEPTAPTLTGFTFAGWSATDGGTRVTFPYAPGVVTDITLYAKWTAVSQNVSGGGSSSPAPITPSSPAPSEPVAPSTPVKSNVTVVAPIIVVGNKDIKVISIDVKPASAEAGGKLPTIKIDANSEKFISEIKAVEGKLVLTPETGFSGKKTVTVIITENGADRIVQIPLIVLPEAVTKPVLTPNASNKTLIRWTASPNATTYTALLNGKKVCSTSAYSCLVSQVLGPDAVIEVIANGGDRTVSEKIVADFRQTVPVPITRLVSATITKATLTKVDTKALDKIVALVRNQGFGTIVISEITTTKKTAALAAARIAAIRKYIDDKTGSREITFEIVPAVSRTYFNNISVKG